MDRSIKKSKFRTSSLVAILVMELIILDIIFMLCIVEVYASQLQTSDRVVAEEFIVAEIAVVTVPGALEDAEISGDESRAEIDEDLTDVQHEPEITKIAKTTEATTNDVYKRHYVNAEFNLYDIPLSDELQRYTFDKCLERGLNYEMVLAVMFKESTFRENAVSRTNDYGIMQINRMNHKWLSESLGITDFLDPKQSIDAGTFYLKGIADNGFDDMHQILMAYNLGGRGAKDLWHQGITTTAYSRGVIDYMESLRWMRRSKNQPLTTDDDDFGNELSGFLDDDLNDDLDNDE
jgi:hypothetical protein